MRSAVLRQRYSTTAEWLSAASQQLQKMQQPKGMNIAVLRELLADIQQSFQQFDASDQRNKFLELQNSQLLVSVHQTFEAVDQEPHARELFLGLAEAFLGFQKPQNQQLACTNESLIAMICMTIQKTQGTEPSLQRHAKCLLSQLIDLIQPDYALAFTKTAVLQVTDLTASGDTEVSLLGFKFALRYLDFVFKAGLESDFHWRLAFVQLSAMMNHLLKSVQNISEVCRKAEGERPSDLDYQRLQRDKTEVLERLIYLREFVQVSSLTGLLCGRLRQQVVCSNVIHTLRLALGELSLFAPGLFASEKQTPAEISPSTRAYIPSQDAGLTQKQLQINAVQDPLPLRPQAALYLLNCCLEKFGPEFCCGVAGKETGDTSGSSSAKKGAQAVPAAPAKINYDLLQFDREAIRVLEFYDPDVAAQLMEMAARLVETQPWNIPVVVQALEVLKRMGAELKPEWAERIGRELKSSPACRVQVERLRAIFGADLAGAFNLSQYEKAVSRDKRLATQDVEDQIATIAENYPPELHRFIAEHVRDVSFQSSEAADEVLLCGFDFPAE